MDWFNVNEGRRVTVYVIIVAIVLILIFAHGPSVCNETNTNGDRLHSYKANFAGAQYDCVYLAGDD